MALTTAEKLDEVQTAITAILGGAQEYTSSRLSVKRADLSALLRERKQLEAMLASESGNDVAVAFLDHR